MNQTTGKTFDGNLHVAPSRCPLFVAASAVPDARSASLRLGAAALSLVIASCLVQPVSAGTAFETKTGDTAVYTFGESGNKENIGESIVSSNRFAFRSGTVNVKAGGYVHVNGYDTGGNASFANWIGAGSDTATLNIDGGTFWIDVGGASNAGAGVLRIGVNGGENDATVNLVSGVFRVDKYLHIGGTLFNSSAVSPPNSIDENGKSSSRKFEFESGILTIHSPTPTLPSYLLPRTFSLVTI